MRDLEKMIREADFSVGSDHKERLHAQLFSPKATKIQPFSAGVELSDDELDMAAGGASGLSMNKQYCPICKSEQTFTNYQGAVSKCNKCKTKFNKR